MMIFTRCNKYTCPGMETEELLHIMCIIINDRFMVELNGVCSFFLVYLDNIEVVLFGVYGGTRME